MQKDGATYMPRPPTLQQKVRAERERESAQLCSPAFHSAPASQRTRLFPHSRCECTVHAQLVSRPCNMSDAQYQCACVALPAISNISAVATTMAATAFAPCVQVTKRHCRQSVLCKRAHTLHATSFTLRVPSTFRIAPAHAPFVMSVHRTPSSSSSQPEQAQERMSAASASSTTVPRARIVLICGFETFNLQVYHHAAAAAAAQYGLEVRVLTDMQLTNASSSTESAIRDADAVLASLIFDYDQVQWLSERLSNTSVVFVFESALELMELTQVGTFSINRSSGKSEMPASIKFALKKLGLLGREEDKLSGYLTLLKNAPRFLKLVPGKKARDLANWLSVYAYWNAGGVENVTNMLEYITREVLNRPLVQNGSLPQAVIPEVKQIPNIGLLHPCHGSYFEHPAAYMAWYEKMFPERIESSWPVVAVLLYRKHVVSKLKYIPHLIEHFERQHIIPLPVFITGVEAHIIVRDFLTSEFKTRARVQGVRLYGSYRQGKIANVDAVVSTIGFPLVGGPAGSMAGARNAEVGQKILQQLNVPYIVAAPLLIQDMNSWQSRGVAGLQSVVLYSLPELDGAIDTVVTGALVGDQVQLLQERISRLTGRLKNWVQLRRKPNEQKKLAIIIYGFPPSTGATGTAALLNVPKSLKNLLVKLREEGYDVGNASELSGEEIVRQVKESDEVLQGGRLAASSALEALQETATVRSDNLKEWIGNDNADRIERSWGTPLGSSKNLKTVAGTHLLGGVFFGNIWIGVQPPLGVVGDPMRMIFERDLTPHPQYAAFYLWLENAFRADAILHLGTHGTYEWLPGNPLGNTKESWSDIFVSNLPNLYVYTANNPSEASLAKRRGYATIISHNVPPYGRAALYGQLDQLKSLIWEFNEAMQQRQTSAEANDERLETISQAIQDKLITSGLNVDLNIDPNKMSTVDYVSDVSQYLKTLESRLFSSGLHVLGKPPNSEEALGFAEAILGDDPEEISAEIRVPLARAIVSSVMDTSAAEGNGESSWSEFNLSAFQHLDVVAKATEVLEKLKETGNELENVIRALDGEFIEALPGGDVLRDGVGVLPTGSNIHALDPYRLPSPTAYETGRAIAERVIQAHRDSNGGEYPETMAVPLWGLDNIKTKGESVGIALGFIGAEPVLDGTGRVVRFELIDLNLLQRPRVDVLLNLSGIFRDSFEHVVFLLDDMCRRAAEASEPTDMNFVKKHAQAMSKENEVDAGARIFSNPPADYGSMVNEQVADSTWENGDELAETFVNRNAYVYGRNSNGRRDKGTLKKMLSTTSRIVQQIDSVEYGLSDIQEYYANTGALVRAARVESKNENVGASIVESFGAARDGGFGREPKELDQVLRMELRTRLLNPIWAEKMLENGRGGAFEVASRMTALIGWGGTAGYGDDFVFEQAAERYVLDEKNREILRRSSPEAFRNVLSRFIEASGRGIWKNPDELLLHKIREQLEEVDSEIEGVYVQ